MSLDPTVRDYFDEIFRRQPNVVFEVLTGEALTDEHFEPGSSITEIVNPDGAFFASELYPFFDTTHFEVEPKGPEADTEFAIGWIEINRGSVSQGHTDQVVITNIDTGEAVFQSDRIEVEAMATDATVVNDVTVPGLPAGNYSITLTLNVDGAYNPSEATTDKGLATGIPLAFGVGGFDPTRPATAEQANVEAVGNAAFYLGSINNTGEEARAQENLALALEAYVGVIPAGLTEGDDLMPRILQAAQTVRGLEIADPVAFQQAISADADAAAGVMQQVTGLTVTPAAGADALLDLVDKAAAAAAG
jgi:hypothetical protein